MTFYDLSIPYRDEKNDHTSHFTPGKGELKNKIKRYTMPMVIKNTESNKVRNSKIKNLNSIQTLQIRN